jgi:hypothetical protein
MTLRIFKNSTSKTLSSSQWESKGSDPWPFCSNMLSFSSVHIALHALILYLTLILRIWVHTWLVILSHAVMSVVQVFPSLWCWFWLVLSVESVGLPSFVMWGDRGEIRCSGLSKVWNGARGAVVPRLTRENLSNAMVLRTTLVKPGIRPIVNLCNDMYWSLGHTPKEV